MSIPARFLLLPVTLVFVACAESEIPDRKQVDSPAPPTTPAAPESTVVETFATLAQRGKAVYAANCIACHNPDPGLDGGIGPAVAGASPELLEARIMRAQYPDGYTPKQPSQVMVALPYLEGDLAALAAYLAPPRDDLETPPVRDYGGQP